MGSRKVLAFAAMAFAVGLALGLFLAMPNSRTVPYEEGAAFGSVVKNHTLVARVLTEELTKTAAWSGTDTLPISPNSAVLAARSALAGGSEKAVTTWGLESVQLRRTGGKYYYVVRFEPEHWEPTWDDAFAFYQVIVYLTGKVQLPSPKRNDGT